MVLQPGDILHCRSNGFIGRAIRRFTKSRINHTALVIELYGQLFIIDSQRDGTNPRPLIQWIKNFSYTYSIHRPSGYDIKEIRRKALSKSGNSKYDFAALLWHQPIYILFGKWVGRKHIADRKMFCSEYVAWVFSIDNWHKLSPQALFEELNNKTNFTYYEN